MSAILENDHTFPIDVTTQDASDSSRTDAVLKSAASYQRSPSQTRTYSAPAAMMILTHPVLLKPGQFRKNQAWKSQTTPCHTDCSIQADKCNYAGRIHVVHRAVVPYLHAPSETRTNSTQHLRLLTHLIARQRGTAKPDFRSSMRTTHRSWYIPGIVAHYPSSTLQSVWRRPSPYPSDRQSERRAPLS